MKNRIKVPYFSIFALAFLILLVFLAYRITDSSRQIAVLQKIVARLEADSRIAQVLVTDTKPDPGSGKIATTVKFLEFDSIGRPMTPKYFTFTGNIIQFQSLVVRFQDSLVKKGDKLKGKSAYLFLKAYFLDGNKAEVYDISPAREIPSGYKLDSPEADGAKIENDFWAHFWDYALNPEYSKKIGIKNAQIEAPGTKFVAGTLYTIKIEHDGGMRIDAEPIPEILKGEKIKF